MKKIFIAAIAAIALLSAATLTSCSKNSVLEETEFVESIAQAQVFDLSLRFDSNVNETEIKILDGDGNVVNQDSVSCPSDVNEIVSVSFLSETTPEFIFTPGLQNGEGGFIRISESSLTTKSNDSALLLIIRQ